MELQNATRKQAKIRLCLQGASGSGKTMSALLIAYGLCGDWSKIAVIDTENYSASLYAHLGGFKVLNLDAPFTPERYIQAIDLCESSGIEVIILDSISHEWEGIGGIIDAHSKMSGNSFTNWSKVTPRHQAFIQCMLQSKAHIIGTIRAKQDYILVERNGKQVPEKVGLKGIVRENTDYEMTMVLNMDMNHLATPSKDRTGLFKTDTSFRISIETGVLIRNWCMEGEPEKTALERLKDEIRDCGSLAELGRIYIQNPSFQNTYGYLFSERKKELLLKQNGNEIIQPKMNHHGIGNH